ncbi:leucine--tRNA ligase [candidate division Kazan bacterium RBG_13_50_9]|uniref:Leucine--tRNA ligase n=1 Tax=candidate division Kazan bacterium RBG_13_50_9 TaxID=1798535 RepID=A0A1F4NSF1_UNCK3|nr:MAG: leucine--tRNA ligase [candidate division Kazan bacterium RBG_13_50_9]
MAQKNAKYDHQKTEAKWQKFWQRRKIFKGATGGREPKIYILDMFPYPSGEGLHVGHPRGYVGSDVLAQYYRLNGYNVLHPMGFDAFGLPAENAAIKAGIHPAINTKKNIKRFSSQLKALGLSYDWNRAIDTSDPSYYRWTQWLFTLLHKNKLAYQKEAYVNWCPKDKTVLANEQVVGGRCQRCEAVVVQKKRKQWLLKITDFAEELLAGLDQLDWPESTKELQRNWIGRSVGTDLEFKVVGHARTVKVFTTRADTLFGATYLVLAPEHPDLLTITAARCRKSVNAYIKSSGEKTELERLATAKTKTGVFIGTYAINPASGQNIPIWVADYVLGSYGYGAIMAVPAHDERDFEFAKQYKLPIVEVVNSPGGKLPYLGEGPLVNSGRFGGMPSSKAAGAITKEVGGQPTVQYRLRDWLISRQRYWGAPIPVLYDTKGQPILVEPRDLPVRLPQDVEFKPTGASPLADSKQFSRIPQHYRRRGAVKREFDTMDTFVCSSWYFMRYADSDNSKAFAGKKQLAYWLPVDVYIGGVEHAAGHLLYARFITKVLHRLGLVSFDEPFRKLRHQGLILGEDNEKMSKSRGNVINPDDVIEGYGADALRMYEMFMGPFDQAIPWSAAGIEGVWRFIKRVWGLTPRAKAPETDRAIHKLIKKVTGDIEAMHFNTAISSFMEFVNLAMEVGITAKTFKTLAILLAPFAPHLAEALNERLGSRQSIFSAVWPTFDPKLVVASAVTIAVQVDGRLRGTIVLLMDTGRAEAIKAAAKLDTVKKHLQGRRITKQHYVPGRIINFVTR